MEQWREIAGYEGSYEVSDLGRVRSLARDVPLPDSRIRRQPSRLLSPGGAAGDYLRVVLRTNGNSQTKLVHRLVAEAFLGEKPEGCEVNHKDADKHNPSAANLEWISRSDNQKHACRLGLSVRTKLSPAAVARVRSLYQNGFSQSRIAMEFGVDQSLVSLIVRNRIWSHAI